MPTTPRPGSSSPPAAGSRLPEAAAAGAALSLENVEVVYQHSVQVLRGLSLAVPAKAIVALLGSNGAGKTTTLKAVSGLLPLEIGEIRAGSIRYLGERINDVAPHLLARRGIAHVREGRHVFEDLTVEENLKIVRLCLKYGKRLVFPSTSEVYGDPQVHPQPEGDWGNVNPIGIRSCYDEGKRVAETLMMDYHRQNGVDTRIARIFNTFGPRMALNDGRVISNFIVQALKGEPITIYGDGSQTRSFCYIDDCLRGIDRIMHSPDLIATPINLGSSELVSINTLVSIVEEIAGVTLERRYDLGAPKGVAGRNSDNTFIRSVLGWEPNTPLRDGMAATYAWIAEQYAARKAGKRVVEG